LFYVKRTVQIMAFIQFPEPLIEATFLKRYKRFLTDMKLTNGDIVVAHCPNTGSMKTCLQENAPALLWDANNPKRKLRYSFKAIKINKTWIGIDTLLPNKLAELAIAAGEIEELDGYELIEREKKMGQNSRVDLLLSNNKLKCYVEVKNVTMVENSVASFPDAITTRGQKHLVELMERVKEGHKAAMLFMIQRGDGKVFTSADAIDSEYAKLLKEAESCGVMLFAMSCKVSKMGVETNGLVEIRV